MKFGFAAAIASAVAIVAGAAGVYVSTLQTAPAVAGVPFARGASPKKIPELGFQDGNGQPRSLADFRGKLVLLNIWATWCAPCREEMPALDRLHSTLSGRDFEVVALSIDQQGIEPVRRFFAENGIKALAPYIDPSARAGFTLGAVGVPTTLLIDRAGREIGRHTGPAKWDAPDMVADLRRRIAQARKE